MFGLYDTRWPYASFPLLQFPSLPVAIGPVELEFVSAVHEEGFAVPLNRVVRDVTSSPAITAVNDEDKDDDELTTHVRVSDSQWLWLLHPAAASATAATSQARPALTLATLAHPRLHAILL